MRFAVTRTSVYDDDESPCAEAVKGTMPRWQTRTCRSVEEFDQACIEIYDGYRE